MCFINPVNTRQDMDSRASNLRDRVEQTAQVTRPFVSELRGQMEYRRWLKEPGVTIHADGVIEIPHEPDEFDCGPFVLRCSDCGKGFASKEPARSGVDPLCYDCRWVRRNRSSVTRP